MTDRFHGRRAGHWGPACAASIAVLLASAAVPAQSQVPVPPPAVAPAPSITAARTFTAPVGLLFNTVRADKALEFERLVAAVRAALEASTDPALKALAKGWRFYKAAEPGPANSVLYVFIVDPTVPGEDYGLGRVLSQGSTDTVGLQEIWKLYTGSVTGGGSLLNLSPIPVPPPEPVGPAGAGPAGVGAAGPPAPAGVKPAPAAPGAGAKPAPATPKP